MILNSLGIVPGLYCDSDHMTQQSFFLSLTLGKALKKKKFLPFVLYIAIKVTKMSPISLVLKHLIAEFHFFFFFKGSMSELDQNAWNIVTRGIVEI